MTTLRRRAAAAAVVAFAAVVVILAGRWEQHRFVAEENRGMRAVLTAVGRLDGPRISGYRLGPPDCIAYSTSTSPYGLQLCFDRVGRLVEAVDRRRGSKPRYYSLVRQSAEARLHLPEARIQHALAVARGGGS